MQTDYLSPDQVWNVVRAMPRAAGRFLLQLGQRLLVELFEGLLRLTGAPRDQLADELQQVMEQGDDQ